MELAHRIRLARGQEPADLLLQGGRLINVFTGDIYEADIAIQGSWIVGVGEGYTAREVIPLRGRFVAPGFIDAHVHIESSMVPPPEFARAVVPHGTTVVIIDPHEIANVLGLDGIRYMLNAAKYNPLSVFVMLPSCVPASPLGTAGATLYWYDLRPLLSNPWVLGLAEMMNYPGVINGDPVVLDKLRAFAHVVRDGHAPQLTGRDLVAYAAAGMSSDHECTTAAEALEKARLGMYVFVRESSVARNLADLLPAITPANSRRFCFCTDDRHPADLLDEGHIDALIRKAVRLGLDPVTAIRMATLNTAEHYRLHDRGAIAPGRLADLVVFSDLYDLRPELVFRHGVLVAENGRPLWEPPNRKVALRHTINIAWDQVRFRIPARGRRIHVIGVVRDQVITRHLIEEATIADGEAVADPGRDLLKIAVIERHRATGQVGLGFVKGMGLRRGALASSVAHDHHNIVVVGADDRSMETAVRAIAETGGGMAAAEGETVLARLPLPIAGLMSDQPIETVRREMDAVLAAARALGSELPNPLMTLSFLALEVIPELKLTDQGLVDVVRFERIPLFAGED
ncbi:MAG: adenine deaminase [Thermoflexus sp.]|uniref:adenine deaminase n=1 Tax=Thermoflexus sp. TaxID=1969742 RepID=UPI00331A238F